MDLLCALESLRWKKKKGKSPCLLRKKGTQRRNILALEMKEHRPWDKGDSKPVVIGKERQGLSLQPLENSAPLLSPWLQCSKTHASLLIYRSWRQFSFLEMTMVWKFFAIAINEFKEMYDNIQRASSLVKQKKKSQLYNKHVKFLRTRYKTWLYEQELWIYLYSPENLLHQSKVPIWKFSRPRYKAGSSSLVYSKFLIIRDRKMLGIM